MNRISFRTAGESHGRGLVALIEGIPAGLDLVMERDVDPELKRRQGGYGRGRRMQIESDRAELMSGVRLGETLGSPIAMVIWNRDWENWLTAMSPLPPEEDGNPKALRAHYLPRPGHADLVGALKYDRRDVRDILERASARETAARVACGAVAKRLLAEFGVSVESHVVSIGSVEAPGAPLPEALNEAVDQSPVRCLDDEAAKAMMAEIDDAKERGDTLGGIFEVVATGLPAGLGSYVSWDAKLDGRLAGAMMSVQAVKGVEIGLGFEGARRPGSQVHDPIVPAEDKPRTGALGRSSNRAGGLEGGVTTGEPLVVRGAMKPISTLRKRLPSVDLRDGSVGDAAVERSDVCAVPAAAVVGEAMVALVLADAFLDKFGGDAMSEVRRNFEGYLTYLTERGFGGAVTDGELQRVVLVGFMASGKTTVGRLLAEELGWRFVDMDDRIEAHEGRTIPEIFALQGEAYFRDVEAQVGKALLDETGVVIGSGGGWAAHPGRLASLPDGTASVWLRVSAEEAVRRAGEDPATRPLLEGQEPLESARALLADRMREYASATVEVDTEGESPEDVSAGILRILASRYPEIPDKRMRLPHAQ